MLCGIVPVERMLYCISMMSQLHAESMIVHTFLFFSFQNPLAGYAVDHYVLQQCCDQLRCWLKFCWLQLCVTAWTLHLYTLELHEPFHCTSGTYKCPAWELYRLAEDHQADWALQLVQDGLKRSIWWWVVWWCNSFNPGNNCITASSCTCGATSGMWICYFHSSSFFWMADLYVYNMIYFLVCMHVHFYYTMHPSSACAIHWKIMVELLYARSDLELASTCLHE